MSRATARHDNATVAASSPIQVKLHASALPLFSKASLQEQGHDEKAITIKGPKGYKNSLQIRRPTEAVGYSLE